MEDSYALGSEETTYKFKYLLFVLGMYFLIFFFYLGADAADRAIVTFYLWFGAILGLLPFLLDLIVNKNKDLPLDTISYEDNSQIPFLNNVYVQVGLSIVLSLLLFYRIKVTQSAFVQAPMFHIQLFNANPTLNGVLSGLTGGIIETMVFFCFILPTIYAICRKIGFDTIISTIITVIMTTAIFTGYHFWHYHYLVSALISVALFGIIQSVLTLSFRSAIPAFMTHFTNNFAVVLFSVTTYTLFVVV